MVAWDRLGASYDQVARRYESRFLDELDGKPRDRELLCAFAAAVDDPVVEVGCGPGQVGAFVRREGRFIVGVDVSSRMARLARDRLDSAVVADMRCLPIPSGTLGGLIAFYSLIHIRRAELVHVSTEMWRVLRPGGRVLFSAHEGHGEVELDEFLGERAAFAATFFELDELVEASRVAGFNVVLAERRPPYPSEGATVRLYVEAERPERHS